MAIYQSTFLSPNNITVDANDPVILTAQLNGTTITDYEYIIYTMDNLSFYDSNKIHLDAPLYNKDILTITILPTDPWHLSNGNQYKWKLIVWEGVNSATSREVPFFCYSKPTVGMNVTSPITSKEYTFFAYYNQAEEIPLLYWYMCFLDEDDKLILQTPNNYSGNIQYNFDGFFSNKTYKVYTVVVNQQNITAVSPTCTFSTPYIEPNLNIVPSATLLSDLSAVQIDWANPIEIRGTLTGTASNVNGLFVPSNTGLKLDNLSSVEFNVNIPIEFTATINYIPDSSFVSGTMVELTNDNGDYFKVGYNGTNFYYDHNGIIENGTSLPLPREVFMIVIKSVEVLIIKNNQIYEQLLQP